MPEFIVTAPDGRKVKITGAEQPTAEQLDNIFAELPSVEQRSALDKAWGAYEAFNSMATSAIAEPLAGLAGIGAAIVPGGKSGAEAVQSVREGVTFSPMTEAGQESLQGAMETLEPVSNAIGAVESAAGEAGYNLAGPVGGAIGETIPTAIGEALGIGAARKAKNISRATPDGATQEILDAGGAAEVPVLTTDVAPPQTFVGKWMQGISEKLGPLGSGSARQSQQRARQAAVQGIVDEMDIELDSPFADSMIRSINTRSARTLERAGKQRSRAVSALNEFGEVPVNRTLEEIDRQIARQARLGEKADKTLMANLESIRSSIQGGNFELVKDIRTEVINDLKALSRSEDMRATGAIQDVKSAIDKDMVAFARINDRDAAADWLRSNRTFAEELTTIKNTELRSILNRGEATPEVVLPVLKRGRPAELKRLYNALGDQGKASARAAIIHDALKESGFFSGDINPDRFATAMQKPNRQQAVTAFFHGAEKKQLDGLVRLLDATRRAQQASAAPATGVQMVPFMTYGGFAGGLTVNPFATMAATGTLSAIAKAYESRPFRNLLVRLKNSKPGSRAETGALELAIPLVLEGLQVARTEQEENPE